MAKKSISDDNAESLIDYTLFSSGEESLYDRSTLTMLPLSPALDLRLGGGLTERSLVMMRTLAKTGKTVLAMQAAANALEQGRYVFYLDLENRLNPYKYYQIKGFNPKNPKWKLMQSSVHGKPISGETAYQTVMSLMSIPKYNGSLYVIDSFSKATTQATLDDPNIKADRRDATPKLNADFCKKVGNLLRISNSIVIGIQHYITDVNAGPYGDPLKPDGGIKFEYECDIVLQSRAKPTDWNGEKLNQKDPNQSIPGQLIKWQIPYNAMLAPYLSKDYPIQNYIKFGEGVYWARELFEVFQSIGFIFQEKKGYYTFLTEKFTDKVHGSQKAIDLIDENVDYFKSVFREYCVTTFGAKYDFRNQDE